MNDVDTSSRWARTWWVIKDGSRHYAVVGERDGTMVAWKVDPIEKMGDEYKAYRGKNAYYHAAFGVIISHPGKGWCDARGYGVDPFTLGAPNGAEPSAEFELGGDVVLSI